jgi:hypothetical protein
MEGLEGVGLALKETTLITNWDSGSLIAIEGTGEGWKEPISLVWSSEHR